MPQRSMLWMMALAALLWLGAACAAPVPPDRIPTPPAWPINVSLINTQLKDDQSGKNTIWLTMPLRTGCMIPGLDQALRELQDKERTVSVRSFDDVEQRLRVYEVTYEFNHPQDIPRQIEELKRVVLETARRNVTPTSTPPGTPRPTIIGPTPTPAPTPTLGIVVAANELELKIEQPLERLIGKRWRVETILGLERLTIGAGDCRVRLLTFQLTMPGEITNVETNTRVELDRLAISTRQPPGQGHIIVWTIDLEQLNARRAAEATRVSRTLVALATRFPTELSQLQATIAIAANSGTAEATRWYQTEMPRIGTKFPAVAMLFVQTPTPVPASIVTLSATSEPSEILIRILITIVAPIVGLVAGVVTVVIGIAKIREILGGSRKANENK